MCVCFIHVQYRGTVESCARTLWCTYLRSPQSHSHTRNRVLLYKPCICSSFAHGFNHTTLLYTNNAYSTRNVSMSYSLSVNVADASPEQCQVPESSSATPLRIGESLYRSTQNYAWNGGSRPVSRRLHR